MNAHDRTIRSHCACTANAGQTVHSQVNQIDCACADEINQIGANHAHSILRVDVYTQTNQTAHDQAKTNQTAHAYAKTDQTVLEQAKANQTALAKPVELGVNQSDCPCAGCKPIRVRRQHRLDSACASYRLEVSFCGQVRYTYICIGLGTSFKE